MDSLGQKWPLSLLSPSVNPALGFVPSPAQNHVPKCHIE